MTLQDLLYFLLSYWGSLIAFVCLLFATALLASRSLFTFFAVVAFGFTLLQRGCHQSLHGIERATGGAEDEPPLIGIEFLFILGWTIVLFILNAKFRRNLPNSLR